MNKNLQGLRYEVYSTSLPKLKTAESSILKSISNVLSPRLSNFITSSIFAVEAKFKVLWKGFKQDNFNIKIKLRKS